VGGENDETSPADLVRLRLQAMVQRKGAGHSGISRKAKRAIHIACWSRRATEWRASPLLTGKKKKALFSTGHGASPGNIAVWCPERETKRKFSGDSKTGRKEKRYRARRRGPPVNPPSQRERKRSARLRRQEGREGACPVKDSAKRKVSGKEVPPQKGSETSEGLRIDRQKRRKTVHDHRGKKTRATHRASSRLSEKHRRH